ncbi:Tetratricopeptide repeat-containing protein [Pedobacter sp. ok626]|uniref:CHAT domain-containing protein n=1 Tax=Pedobacter sp. ok626 TaxID=1761882 RepID=UPI000880C62E|nr:CHAT domain-containing tetratricopeptide repeat protein [Pedobacter sp. ok626]SDK43647.1 Tetratricopeptide repeat-containing protein [Pedobacter sp. ok626]
MEVLARIFLLCLSFFGFTAATAQTPINIPQPITRTLDSLKKQDNLADWLYTRIDYSYVNPRQSLPFLMNTESERWRKPRSTPEKEAWLMLLSNQGYNQMYTGNILNSINCYEQAYNYVVEHKLNVEGIAEYVLKPWANNYTRLGDYEKALFIQQKTLNHALKEHNDPLAVSVYNNMAISYRSLGDFKKAEECIYLGTKKTTPASTELVLLDNTLADIYIDKNELGLAEKIISRNIARQKLLKQNFESAYWLLSSHITAGDIQSKQQHFTVAQNNYQQALAINDKYYNGNRLREKAYIYIQLGKIKLAQKQPDQAIAYFNKVLRTFGLSDTNSKINVERVFGDNRLVDLFYQKSLAYGKLGRDKDALENIQLSLLAADKIRFELADVKTKQRFQSETKQMAENAIAIAFNLLAKTKEHHFAEIIVSIIEQTRARTLLDDIRRNQQQLRFSTKDPLFQEKAKFEQAIAYNEKELLQGGEAPKEIEKRNGELKFKLEAVEKLLTQRYPSLAVNKDIKISSNSLLKQLPRRAHFIEFFAGSSHLYVAEIYNRQVKHIKRVSDAQLVKKNISYFVNTYYHNGPTAMMNQPKSFFIAANQIYKTLLGGFSFAKNEKLIIIPDEVIGYLSFDGMITNDKYQPDIANWPYLIKDLSLSYSFSIQTWLNQSAKKSNPEKSFAGLFVTHQNKNKQFIPAVVKEAESIEKIVAGEFMMDENARVKDFFNAFDKANVLHISTHSYLSGVQKEPTLSFDDEPVFLFELSARKNAPDLVVLSACRTADGMMNTGEGIISLSRGFAAIGTGGTIAGLWNVNDQAASEITASCYNNMLQGQTISIALHHAKLDWLKSKQRPAQEYLPYYWDALVYMGYDKKVTLKPAGNTLADYGKLGALILTAFLGIYYLIKVKKKPISPASKP